LIVVSKIRAIGVFGVHDERVAHSRHQQLVPVVRVQVRQPRERKGVAMWISCERNVDAVSSSGARGDFFED
jgi:hypothetical protein